MQEPDPAENGPDPQPCYPTVLYVCVCVQVGSPEDGLRANEDVAQHLILLRSGEDKDQELVQLFRQRFASPHHLVLVFVARKNTCDFVANMLNRVGIRASAMHSDRTQVLYRTVPYCRYRTWQ